MSRRRPTLLIILDGWGSAAAGETNAVTSAPAENFLGWQEAWPSCLLSASGKEVGLPLGLMGNSEVGHTNVGAGRVVYQEITRIDQAIADGEFNRNAALRGAVEHALVHDRCLHLLGLVGDGGVHASDRHYLALIDLAKSMGLAPERLVFHALLDGRDTPPNSAPGFLQELEVHLKQVAMGRIATVAGRYYAMDRDKRWDRTRLFWDALVHGGGERAETAHAAVRSAAARGETDEFVKPAVIGDPGRGRLADGDAVLLFNFRADRMRQIAEALVMDQFEGFDRGRRPDVSVTMMTRYRKDFPCPVAFPPRELRALFGEVVAARGLTQLRCAETEKYAHVTFFFNGGREEVYPGEERVLVPSPKVATYDLQPGMSADGVATAVLERLARDAHDLYVVNFANSDMVGHTGVLEATREAVRVVDGWLKRIVDAALGKGGTIAITADHGNAEMMVDPVTGGPYTAHTTNPVPFLLIGEAWKGVRLRPMGTLADVAPTLMETMGLEQPSEMDGASLLESNRVPESR